MFRKILLGTAAAVAMVLVGTSSNTASAGGPVRHMRRMAATHMHHMHHMHHMPSYYSGYSSFRVPSPIYRYPSYGYSSRSYYPSYRPSFGSSYYGSGFGGMYFSSPGFSVRIGR